MTNVLYLNAVDRAIATHRVAAAEVRRLIDADVPDGPIFDDAVQAEIDAMDALVKAPCANHQDLLKKQAYIVEFANGDEFEESRVVDTMKAYLEQRAA
jgi:hypothetical protein